MNDSAAQPLTLWPWQRDAWNRLLQPAILRGELHHGLLIVGPAGLGKGRLAKVIAGALLCESPADDGLPCGACRGCHLYATGTHPDAVRVDGGDGKSSSIGVEQVRALARSLSLSSQFGGARVAVVDPADRLTVNAANSLLKTLEEPSARAFLVLVASHPSRLPATVRSRCQQIRLPVPGQAQSVAWLREQPGGAGAEALLGLAGGAPLAALSMAGDGVDEAMGKLVEDLEAVARGKMNPVQAANGWKSKGEARQLVSWVEMLAMDLARGLAGGPDVLQIWDSVRIQGWLESLSSYRVQSFLEWLAATRRDLEQPLNDQLLAEALFVRWRQMSWTGS